MSSPSQANFLLIDGVLRQHAAASLYQRGEALEVWPLYIGTRWQALHDLGPILVVLQGPSDLISETCQSAFQRADASLLYSRAPVQVVAAHLRRFITPPDVLGGHGLLRFADPLVTRHWLGSYQGKHLDAVLGPIDAWHIPENPHSWELEPPAQWRSFHRAAPAAEWADIHAQLGHAQLGALDRAARWRFMERLNQSLERSHPQRMAQLDKGTRTQWFDHRLDEAEAWGLSSERSLVTWFEYSLRWGTGFTLRPDTPYQQWLATTAGALKLAPELRIQQMDKDCMAIEITEEV
jgi:hypothetical protein